MKRRIVNPSAVESSDIGSPPRDSRNSHIDARRVLVSQGLEIGMDIPAPHQRPVFLTAGPRAPQQVNNIFLSLLLHPVKKRFGIHDRIEISNLEIRSQMIPVIVKIVNRIFRFGFIQPKDFNAFVVIVFLCFSPYILSGLRIRRIVVNGVSHIVHTDSQTALRTNQIALLLHFLKVFAAIVDCWPNGHHQFDSH